MLFFFSWFQGGYISPGMGPASALVLASLSSHVQGALSPVHGYMEILSDAYTQFVMLKNGLPNKELGYSTIFILLN